MDYKNMFFFLYLQVGKRYIQVSTRHYVVLTEMMWTKSKNLLCALVPRWFCKDKIVLHCSSSCISDEIVLCYINIKVLFFLVQSFISYREKVSEQILKPILTLKKNTWLILHNVLHFRPHIFWSLYGFGLLCLIFFLCFHPCQPQ